MKYLGPVAGRERKEETQHLLKHFFEIPADLVKARRQDFSSAQSLRTAHLSVS